jgi:oxygen-independent coproporphyrinogen III oxidase
MFGNEAAVTLKNKATRFIEKGEMLLHENTLFLTDDGKLFADGIASEFFMTGK